MAIEATNNVNYAERPQHKSSSALPLATGVGLLAAGTGYFIGSPIAGKDVLKTDKFELSSKAKDVTATDKANEGKINSSIAESKQEKLDAAAAAETEKKFNGKEVLTAEEYLGTTPEKYEKAITETEAKTPALDTAVKTAEADVKTKTEALEKADEAGKAAATTAKTEAEAALKKAQTELDTHNAKIAADKAELAFAKEAKDGIKKDAFKTKVTGDLKSKITSNIDETLKELKGKTPNVKSLKKAGIYGGIAFVGMYLLSKMFGGSNKTEA